MKKVRERGEKTNEKRKQTERMKIWKRLKERKGTIIIEIIIILIIIKLRITITRLREN